MKTTTTALTLALCLLLASPAHADEVTIDITGDSTTVQQLLVMAAEQLEIQLTWGQEKTLRMPIEGKPKFIGSKADVFSQVRTLLLTYDLVLIPIGSAAGAQKATYRVADVRQYSVMSMRAEPIVLTDENLATFEGQPWRFVTTSIQLEHLSDLRNLRTALSKIVTGSSIGQITEVPQSRSFMVTDFAPKVVAMYRMIRRMDVEPLPTLDGKRVAVIKMEFARAKDISNLIDVLLRPRAPAVKGRQIVPPDVPRVVADDRTNQIVLSGEARSVALIEEMIKKLDVPSHAGKPLPPRPPTAAKVVHLKHMQAVDAAASLTEFVRGATELFDVRPTVVALRSTNALVIAGTERAHKVIGELIQSLDRAPNGSEKEDGK